MIHFVSWPSAPARASPLRWSVPPSLGLVNTSAGTSQASLSSLPETCACASSPSEWRQQPPKLEIRALTLTRHFSHPAVVHDQEAQTPALSPPVPLAPLPWLTALNFGGCGGSGGEEHCSLWSKLGPQLGFSACASSVWAVITKCHTLGSL